MAQVWMCQLTIGAFPSLWRAVTTWEEHFGRGTTVGHVDVQPGKRDGIFDDGRNGGRRRRQVLGSLSGSAVGAPPDLTQRPGEEGPDLVVRVGQGICVPAAAVSHAAVVAEKGGVPEHVATSAHVHGVAEVPEGGADHVQCEVASEATLAVGVGHQAFEARQLLLKIHDPVRSARKVQHEKSSGQSAKEDGKFSFCLAERKRKKGGTVIREICKEKKIKQVGAEPGASGLISEFITSGSDSVPVLVARSYAWLVWRRAHSQLRAVVFLDAAVQSGWSAVRLPGFPDWPRASAAQTSTHKQVQL